MKTIYTKLLILVLLLPLSAFAQGTLNGKVTDQASGQPLPGVSIIIQSTQNGTSTDMDGNFSLSNVKRGDKLVFSFIGYKEVVQNYDGQKSVSVVMEEQSSELQEVVVQVGYGSVKKKDATGSVTTVSEKDFNRGANVTTENLLNGRVAGLVINTSGAPGSGSQIRIRGGGSLLASNEPLIVVDGLPIENTTNTGSTSFLATLNPNTVESISVLKDASATAIYGSRASNGVIIITTKRGGKDLSFEYNFQYGLGKLVKTIDVFSGDEYRALIADKLPGKVTSLGTANTNWQDAIYRKTDLVDQSATLRGNLFKTIPARLTVGRTYQEGLRLTNEFTRNTVGLAMSPVLFDNHLRMRINANYSNETNRFADGVEGSAIAFDPTQPIYDANSPYGGFFQYYTGDGTLSGSTLSPNVTRNPVAQLLQTYDNGRNNRTFGNIEMDYKLHFFPDLRVVVNGGFDEAHGVRTRLMGRDAGSAPSNANQPFGKDELELENRRNKLLDAYFVYSKTINDFSFELTAGHSYQKFESEKFTTGNRRDLLVLGNSQFPETDRRTPNVLEAYFARTNLTLNDFLLTLSYRRDGTSRFSSDNRWGNFPAAAFAWKLKDALFKNSASVSDLKLRLGYGITGTQNFDFANAYLQKFITGSGTAQYYFGAGPVPIAQPDRISPDLKWEEATTYNAGLDFGFAENRITGSIDAFYRETNDLIQDAPIADGGNNSNYAIQNIGSFTTKGLEFSINANVVKTADFNWNVNFNASTFQRKVTELANHQDVLTGENVAGTGSPVLLFKEGFSPFSYYVFKQLYDTDNNPIEGAYADLNNDNVINESDRYVYKNQDPDVTMGFASTMNIGNLDFSFNLRASIGNHVFNGVNASQAQYALLQNGAALNNLPSSVLDTDFNTTSNVLKSDIFVENASFLRMDNITLGYTFPKWLDGKASLRLSAGVQNAFVLTKYSGLDPEITNNGLDKTIYPRQRTLLFGANVKF
ncbi:SusC/RagA family TonB-linked outer membrane protein [Flavobacterium magnum]|uniref:SusC/RagA family TonB-linked outer membrane protein n=1 Tax=Flavobacterium magnum TaxID=2162713 RepID=A0A2S0RFU1_9FLAO|nr:SusC/RagA family TonB-linked outer membrane protein [Flavobacterium magnum]AWA29582.1 SusC/RagA family TonB-linked outer membrane protein [Flavobacterium magnum]